MTRFFAVQARPFTGRDFILGARRLVEYAVEVEPVGGWEVERLQGARGVGGVVFPDDCSGVGDEGAASVWADGGL